MQTLRPIPLPKSHLQKARGFKMAKTKQKSQRMNTNEVLIHCNGSFDTITLHKNDVVHFKFDKECDNEEVQIFCNVVFPLSRTKAKKRVDDYTVSLSS